tara:strand:- start:437 stop:1585 length:1149 start_codon:yes stop_codon:yes gene_type:complete
MLKNKIYKYFTFEILKEFLTILFAFTAIAWTVRAVNFLDLIVEDGHSIKTYLTFSLLNLTNIVTKFIPLTFFIALTVSIAKFERQNEFLILWTAGLNKIKIVNLFFLISILILFIQIFFSTFVTPNALSKSRALVKLSDLNSINSIIKTNDFSDSFKSVTFYVETRNEKNEMKNIFIRDENNAFKNLTSDTSDSVNTTIIAKTGIINNKKLILNDGLMQTQNKDGVLKNINFKKTEFIINSLVPRTIVEPKLQETLTSNLILCTLKKDEHRASGLRNCNYDKDYNKDVVETLARRIGMPIYIPILALICSFLLVSTKNKKRYLRKYLYFAVGFFILVLAEVMVRYSGFSKLNTLMYFLFPFLLTPIIYLILIKKFAFEKTVS